MNIGFIEPEVKTRLAVIQRALTNLAEGKPSIFEEKDQITNHYVTKWWQELIDKKKVDVLTPQRAKKLIQADTIKHKDVREIGAEWIGYQTLEQLEIRSFRRTRRE